MFACMFLQLHGDKGVDYCLSETFGFFLMPFCPWWSDAHIGGCSALGPDLSGALRHFTIRFMKLTVMNATYVTVVTWGFISLRGWGLLPPPFNICSDLHTSASVCQVGWLMRGKLSMMMSSLDRREEGLCYYYAGGAPRPVFLRRGTARVSSSLFDEARYDP